MGQFAPENGRVSDMMDAENVGSWAFGQSSQGTIVITEDNKWKTGQKKNWQEKG